MCSAANATADACEVDANNLCAAHHTGPLCQVCKEGYYQPTRGALCTSCGSASSVASYSTAGALVVALIATLLACLFLRRRRRLRRGKTDPATEAKKKGSAAHRTRRTLREALWRRLQSESLRNKCKLVISLFQVVGSFDVVFDVPYVRWSRTEHSTSLHTQPLRTRTVGRPPFPYSLRSTATSSRGFRCSN